MKSKKYTDFFSLKDLKKMKLKYDKAAKKHWGIGYTKWGIINMIEFKKRLNEWPDYFRNKYGYSE